jgi:hypothetical protein
MGYFGFLMLPESKGLNKEGLIMVDIIILGI